MKRIISFVLILTLAFSLVSCKEKMQTPADSSVNSIEQLDFSAQYVRTFIEYTPKLPYTEVIHSKAELDSYIERFAVNNFETSTEKYTDEFFSKKQLVLCMIEEPSGSIRHKVKKVTLDSDAYMSIHIKRDIPEVGTDDMALWLIIVETKKTDIKNDGIDIIVDGKSKTNPTDINYTKGAIGISLKLKKGWQHTVYEQDGEYGIEFFPKGETGAVRIIYRETALGLCGTGLTTDTVTIGSYTAESYQYDDMPGYFMANFKTVSGGYYLENNGAENWWTRYEKDALEILNTLKLSDITMTRDEALRIAKEQTTREYTEEYVNYDAQNGNWVVTLKNSEWTETYNISENGHSMTATPTNTNYSEKVDYFKDNYEFWDGKGDGVRVVRASAGRNIVMSVGIPKGWSYKKYDYLSKIEGAPEGSFGIYIWPQNEPEGKIYISYSTEKKELGCGTGTDSKEVRLGKYDATVCTYYKDVNKYMWDVITVLNKTNSVKILSEDAHLWWNEYYDEAIKIMSSLTVEENVCTLEDAIKAVCTFVGADELKSVGGEYSFEKNEWIVTSLDKRYTVSADATVVKVME